MDVVGVRFVGRERELAHLRRMRERCLSGRAVTILVTGESGMGKTALLHHFVDESRALHALWTSGDEGEASLDLGLFGQLSASLRAERPNGASPLQDPVNPDDPLQVGHVLTRALEARLRRGPLAIIVEEAEWTDRVSAEALLFAVRHLAWERLLVILTTQGETAIPPSTERWNRLIRDPETGCHLRLAGLDVPTVGELAAAMGVAELAPPAAERLWRHTEGHPGLTRLFLTEAPQDPFLWTADLLPAPRSLVWQAGQRLASLPPAGQRLVTAAAVLGPDWPFAGLMELADVTEGWTLAQDLPPSDWWAPRALAGGAIQFTRPIYRAAVAAQVDGPRLRALHAKAALMVKAPEGWWHRALSGEPPSEALFAGLLGVVGPLAERGHLLDAARFALQAAHAAPHDAARQLAWLAAVKLLADSGSASLLSSLEAPIRDSIDIPMRNCLLADVALRRGRFAEARTVLEAILGSSDPTARGAMAAETHSRLAELHLLCGEIPDALRSAGQALDTPGIMPPVRLAASVVRSVSLALTGHLPEVYQELADWAAVDPLGLAAQGYLAAITAHFDDALGPLESVTEAARLARGVQVPALWYTYLAETALALGRWDKAAANMETALAAAPRNTAPWVLAVTHAVAAQVYAFAGQLGLADSHVTESLRWYRAAPVWAALGHVAAGQAATARVRRDAPAVLAALAPLCEEPMASRLAALGRTQFWDWWMDALWALGRTVEADQIFARLDHVAPPADARLAVARHERRRAAWWAKRGDARAPGALAAALELLADGTFPWELAQVEAAQGHFLEHTGRRRRAIQAYRAARARFLAMGALPDARWCEEGLARLDVLQSGHARALHLTEQESEVARLATAGLSNPEIARELFISRKTVEAHLGHIYAKVGVRSRADLARVLGPDDERPSG